MGYIASFSETFYRYDIPTFWEKGCRYFKLATPTGEQVEFSQIL